MKKWESITFYLCAAVSGAFTIKAVCMILQGRGQESMSLPWAIAISTSMLIKMIIVLLLIRRLAKESKRWER